MKQLKVLDLFSGTQSIAKKFRERGHLTYTVELDKSHEGIDWYEDIMKITAQDIIERFGHPDVIWASPPCEKFSVASIGRYWTKGSNIPATDESKQALKLLEYTIKLIKDLNPTYFFVENPRGKMRKMDCMQEIPRYTVTYCQYGDTRMKPTDIWTNHPNPNFKPCCKNGDPCHVSAPRGSRTGTQGLKGAKERSVIPSELCEYIVKISEQGFEDKEKHHCSYCGKELLGGEDCYYCADTGEIFCYEEIHSKDDIDKTCIGKDLLKCGYSIDKIYFMIGKDYNEYSKAIEEGTLDGLEDENGDNYPEIFYTTVEE